MHRALQFRVRDRRTGFFTRARPWPRVGDVKQHLGQMEPADLEHMEMVECLEVETRSISATDLLNKTNSIKRPLNDQELRRIELVIEHAV